MNFSKVNLNPTFLGYVMLVEVKSSQKSYQKSQKQFFDGKEKIEEVFAALGLKTVWKYIGLFFALIGTESPLFNCQNCSLFAVIGIDAFREIGDRGPINLPRGEQCWQGGHLGFELQVVGNPN